MVLEVEEGGQDRDEVVRVYLIKFIADLPLGWYTGCMIEYLFSNKRCLIAWTHDSGLDNT